MLSIKARLLNRLSNAITERQQAETDRILRANLKAIGDNSAIGLNPEFYSPECIEIGSDVHIGRYVRIQAITQQNNMQFAPIITIANGVSIENNCTISSNNRVSIGEDAMIASNVFICDHEHQYQDPDVPVRVQNITVGGAVTIGADVHLGQNVSVFGDVTIGEHSVIGANAVVTKDIPPYSVAIGAPARVIRMYNQESKTWEKVSSHGKHKE